MNRVMHTLTAPYAMQAAALVAGDGGPTDPMPSRDFSALVWAAARMGEGDRDVGGASVSKPGRSRAPRDGERSIGVGDPDADRPLTLPPALPSARLTVAAATASPAPAGARLKKDAVGGDFFCSRWLFFFSAVSKARV